jgi:hypothetical protein
VKVIYSCYWGSCLALVAASLHLGYLSSNNLCAENVLKLPGFGEMNHSRLGQLYYIGTDGAGCKIYILGSKKSGTIIKRAFIGFTHIYGMGKNSIYIEDLTGLNNFYISTGLLLLRLYSFRKIGFSLLLHGIKKAAPGLSHIVNKTKSTIKEKNKG